MNLGKVLFSGVGVLLQIFIITLILSIPLGIIIAILRNSKCRIISFITRVYILIMRGTPIMLQIIVVYFAPYYLFKINYDRFLAIIIAFVANYAAYFAEIFRSGINSIPKGQKEAAYTLGFNRIQVFFLILFPQIVKRVLPPVSNEVVSLLKSTSLAQIIGISEMFALAQKQANYYFSVTPLFIAGMYYLVLTFLVSLIFNKVEKKMEYYS
ncbi:MAG TPA: amino acid ABC transporter permease [Candidatus Scatovivens faecipullorum]|nr:amino acid ABC transporter permease [Candidatus Scatovivens faecipullorum]